jgi:hypothetical protein
LENDPRIRSTWTLEALGQTFLGHALVPLQFPQECLLPEVSRVAFTNYQCGETQVFDHCCKVHLNTRKLAEKIEKPPEFLGKYTYAAYTLW